MTADAAKNSEPQDPSGEHVHGPDCDHHDKPGTFRRETSKVGRNDPCNCGSGKKFKKCCGGGR